ncbi:MAG: hypothetical protein WCI65_12355, partial [Synechococcaceae cyanobacterium ELA263]
MTIAVVSTPISNSRVPKTKQNGEVTSMALRLAMKMFCMAKARLAGIPIGACPARYLSALLSARGACVEHL